MLIGGTELATEVPYGIVIIQGQAAHEGVQFFESVVDLRWVGFVGLGVDLVQLIQDGFAITITGVKGMSGNVGIQPLYNILHISTPLRQ